MKLATFTLLWIAGFILWIVNMSIIPFDFLLSKILMLTMHMQVMVMQEMNKLNQ